MTDEMTGSPCLPAGEVAAETTLDSNKPAAITRSNSLRRFFWLDDRIAEANARSFGPSKAGWREFELARQIRDAIEEANESSESRFTCYCWYGPMYSC